MNNTSFRYSYIFNKTNERMAKQQKRQNSGNKLPIKGGRRMEQEVACGQIKSWYGFI